MSDPLNPSMAAIVEQTKAAAETLGVEIHVVEVQRPGGRPSEKYQRKNSGEIRRGRNSGICGQVMIAASTSSIGTSMIIVSFNA